MKQIILSFTLFFLSLTLFSQVNLVKLDSQLSENFSINVLEQNSQGLTLKLTNNSYYFKDVNTPRGESVIVRSPKARNNFPKGSPDLPIIPTSIV